MTTTLSGPTRNRPPAGRRPHASVLLWHQLVYTLQELWRARVVFIFTFLFPLTWLLVLGFLAGNATVDDGSGVRVMQFVTPSAAAMGVTYAAFPTVAITLSLAREGGVLKRVRGTPLPPWVYLAGRIGGAVVFALGSVVLMLTVGVVAYDVQIVSRTALASVVTIAVAIACFASLGLAVASVSPSATFAQAASIGSAVVVTFLSGCTARAPRPRGPTASQAYCRSSPSMTPSRLSSTRSAAAQGGI